MGRGTARNTWPLVKLPQHWRRGRVSQRPEACPASGHVQQRGPHAALQEPASRPRPCSAETGTRSVQATCSQSPGEARAFAPATCDRVAPPAAGDLEPTAGEARRSHTLRVGRYAQHFVDALQMDENPVEYLLRKYPQARAGARPAAC